MYVYDVITFWFVVVLCVTDNFFFLAGNVDESNQEILPR